MAAVGLNEWEELVWQDLQTEGLADTCEGQSCSQRDTGEALRKSVPSGSPARASTSMASDQETTATKLPSAAGDAGSGCFVAGQTVVNADPDVDPSNPDQLRDEGPFASMEHQQLTVAPSGRLHLPRSPRSLQGTRSIVTYKTKALAAAAGSVRSGAVGSSLRLAAVINRSSSGGLADTLLAEHARAESGLMAAGLGRSDSLPEFNLVPSGGGELSELLSLRDLDFLSGMPTGNGMLSLLTLFGEAHPSTAHPPAEQPRQPPMAAPANAPAAAAPPAEAAHVHLEAPAAVPVAAPVPEAVLPEDTLPPLAMTSSRGLGRPPSFSVNAAAALFGGAGHSAFLRPPSLVDYSSMVQLTGAAPQAGVEAGPACFAAFAGHSAAAQEHSNLGAHAGKTTAAAAAGAEPSGFEGFSMPSFARMPLLMDRQDTFDVLIRQVEQELTAEAEVRQYAALEFDTIDIPLEPPPAAPAPAEVDTQAGAAAQSPFMDATAAMAAAAAAVVPAVLQAAAEPAAKRCSAFAGQPLKRRSVFEGQAALMPADVSSASTTAGTVALDATGPSFAAWAAPTDPSSSSQVSGVPPASPFNVARVAGLTPADISAAAAAGSASAMSVCTAAEAAAAPAKQEVARYSRVITCKTYLKRLNITQPMAEHLLPPHDLNPSTPKGRAQGSEDGGGERPASSYEQLFKEQITIVDDTGATFRVQYEGVSCNSQKHLRLTSGWRDYIRAHNVEVGDSIVFERRGPERRVLYVTLVKAGSGGAEQLGPEPKKRRVVRKQAVQRLD